MRLRKIRIRGFQSFGDSGDISFLDGINLIIGQNNAGKSALLRALLPALPDDRHRTPETWETAKLPKPLVVFTIDSSGHEIRNSILRSGQHLWFPIDPKLDTNRTNPELVMMKFFERPSIQVTVTRESGSSFSAPYPSHQMFRYERGTPQEHVRALPTNGELVYRLFGGAEDSLPQILFEFWSHNMFYFSAERMNVGESAFGRAERLKPDASNLPNVLQTLIGERGALIARLVGHLREIFPTVGNLSVRQTPGANNLEVRVWPTETMERVELSFPLNSSGTGVAQIVAILTAVMTIDNAVIIIDEVSSFLHPAAVKTLLRILQINYAQHQYIISTHAPDVIAFSNPKTIHLVKRVGYDSSVERLDLTAVGQLREVANHLGVSMADVFAAERVIWVEGPTEELCFPYLYQNIVGSLPPGTIFTSVASTGDFHSHKRDPRLVYEVYERLSGAVATLASSTIFSFDTEKLTENEKADMRQQSGGALNFLPRRHFECYLIDPSAIAKFIANRDRDSSRSVTAQEVEDSLMTAASDQRFCIPEWQGEITDTHWLARVNAAKLIAHVCQTLSDSRVVFNKNGDSLFLLQQILDRASSQISELAEYVSDLVKRLETK